MSGSSDQPPDAAPEAAPLDFDDFRRSERAKRAIVWVLSIVCALAVLGVIALGVLTYLLRGIGG